MSKKRAGCEEVFRQLANDKHNRGTIPRAMAGDRNGKTRGFWRNQNHAFWREKNMIFGKTKIHVFCKQKTKTIFMG